MGQHINTTSRDPCRQHTSQMPSEFTPETTITYTSHVHTNGSCRAYALARVFSFSTASHVSQHAKTKGCKTQEGGRANEQHKFTNQDISEVASVCINLILGMGSPASNKQCVCRVSGHQRPTWPMPHPTHIPLLTPTNRIKQITTSLPLLGVVQTAGQLHTS